MSASSERELIELEKRLQHAVKEHDNSTLQRMVSDDFRLTSYRGHPWGVVLREKWIDYACRMQWNTEFEFEDVTVHRSTNAAVVISHIKQNGNFEGRDASGIFVTIDLWRLEDSNWKILSRHAVRE